MKYNDINLWFAKDENENIVTIDKIDPEYKGRYFCPICSSEVKAVAANGITKEGRLSKVVAHFAHYEASKCQEGMLHFWFKNKFIEVGDRFVVKADIEKEYICKSIEVERTYSVFDKEYRPDVTIYTECGNVVYFEMKNTSGKKIQDYLDVWIGLGNIVVEVDIKDMIKVNSSGVREFSAVFYKNKCMSVDRKNKTYYDTIGQYKEKILSGEIDEEVIERVKKLDWFWNDVKRYKIGEVDIEQLVLLIDSIEEKDREIAIKVLKKVKCSDVIKRYVDYKEKQIYKEVFDVVNLYIKQDADDYIEINRNERGDRIGIYNKSDGSFHIYDLVNTNMDYILEECHKYMKINVKHNENKIKMLEYNEKVKYFNNIIDKEVNLKRYKDISSNIDKYKTDICVRSYYCNKYDLHEKNMNDELMDFKIDLKLQYDGYTCIYEQIKFKNQKQIVDVYEEINNKIEEYFNKLKPIKNIDEIENMVTKLNDRYSNLGYAIEVNGYQRSEEYYSLYLRTPIDNFYSDIDYTILNNGIKLIYDEVNEDEGKDEMIVSLVDISKTEKALIKDIDKRLEKVFTIKCVDCNEEFKLSVEEINFFNEKGFKLPKRCKPCRQRRKHN